MRAQTALVLAGAMALAGCAGEEAPPATDVDATQALHATQALDATGRYAAESARGTFHAAVVTENGAPIPLNEPFAVTLELTGRDGSPWAAADAVTLDARMPAHRHGMLRDVELQEVGPGRYRADGLLFHMIGHWEFHVDAVKGPRIERATADVWLEL